MNRRIRPAAITSIILTIFLLTLATAQDVSALTKIYSGRNTVDLAIGELTGTDSKIVLSRDGAEIKSWNGRQGDPLNETFYYADPGCAQSSCTYTLERYLWYEDNWHLSTTDGTVTVFTDRESGTLHNGADWLIKLGRDAVSWNKTGSTYTVDGELTVADGELMITSGVSVYFWGTILGGPGATRIKFTDGTRLSAAGATFSSPEAVSNVNLQFNAYPAGDAYHSYMIDCTFDKVYLKLNAHHGAVFEGNTFTDAKIESYDTNKLEFSENNNFTATTADSLYFSNNEELTFTGNSLTNVGMTLETCDKPVVQGNTANASSLNFSGNGGTIKANSAFDSASIVGTGNNVEGNTINAQLSMYGSVQSVVKGNTFAKLAISGSNHQILDNVGKRIEISDSGNSIVNGNQLSCLDDVANGDDGLYLSGTVAGQTGNSIENNEVAWCNYGIHLSNASGANTIKKNTLTKCGYVGIYLESSSDNQVENNAVNETGYGIGKESYGIQIGNYWNAYNRLNPPDTTLTGSKRNVVVYNSIWGTYGNGIHFPVWPYGNDGNGIHENTIERSTGWAVYIGGDVTSTDCSQGTCTARNIGNFVYNNLFKNNVKNASDIPANETVWNHTKEATNANIVGGTSLGGNYWDDYMGTDDDGDGLGDTPYEIRDASNNLVDQDELPLMNAGTLSRFLVVGAGDNIPALIASQGEAAGEKKLIDAQWVNGAVTGDSRHVVDAGVAGDYTIKATGGFGIAVTWTGCDETTGNGTAEAFCTLKGPLAGGDRVLTANVVKTPYRFIRKWGEYGTGNGQFKAPKGVATDAAGNVYVADYSNHRIQKFDNSGAYLTQWGSNGTGEGQFNSPLAVAADASGNVYVADSLNYRIQKFDSQGTFLAKWGSQGTATGQFSGIKAMALDGSGQNLYVLDSSITAKRVQVFSTDGTYQSQKSWTIYITATGTAVSDTGYAFVAYNSLGIYKYGATGLFSKQFGNESTSPPSLEPGKLTSTYQMAVDKYNHLYVLDSYTSGGKYVVQKFDSEGNYIDQFGGYGEGDGQFKASVGIGVDRNGNVFVSDGTGTSEPHRIQVFAATPLKGDMNGDGLADLKDLIIALQILADIQPTVGIRSNYPASGADVNGDNRAGLAECEFVLQIISGLR